MSVFDFRCVVVVVVVDVDDFTLIDIISLLHQYTESKCSDV